LAGAGAVVIAILPHAGTLLERVAANAPLPRGLRARVLGLLEQVLLGVRPFHSVWRFTGLCFLQS
jgi:hypothetical protein